MSFLEEVEGLRVAEVIARCRALGARAAGGDDEAGQTLRGLRGHASPYARSLGLWAWHGDRDPEAVLGLLQDDSRVLRRRAAGMVHLLDDAHASRGLERISAPKPLRAALGRLSRARRVALIDGFFRGLESNDPRRWDALGFASEALLAEQDLGVDATPSFWRSFALRNPKLALQRLEAQPALPEVLRLTGAHLMRRAPEETTALVRAALLARRLNDPSAAPAVSTLAAMDPEAGLSLFREVHEAGIMHVYRRQILSFPAAPLAWALTRATPAWASWVGERCPGLLDLLVDRPEWRQAMGEERLERARAALFQQFAKHDLDPIALHHLFDADDPRRAALIRGHVQSGYLPHLLETAPRDVAAAIVRGLGRKRLDPYRRAEGASFLPFPEAAQWLEVDLRSRDEWRERQAAEALLKSAARWPEHVDAALAFFAEARRSDSARVAVLTALGELATEHLTPARCERVAPLFDEAFEDQGRWGHVARVARELARTWMAVHPLWALEQLLRFSEPYRSAVSEACLTRIPAEALPAVAARLEPVVGAWVKAKDERSLVALVNILRPHLGELSPVTDALRALIPKMGSPWDVPGAVEALRLAQPRQANAFLNEVLDQDYTFGRLEGFAEIVAGFRQDLLPRLLESGFDREQDYGLRFYWETDPFPAVPRGHSLWTPAQQALHGQQLQEESRQVTERDEARALVRRLAQLSWCPALVPEACEDKRPAFREMAVRALSRVDSRSAALEALLGCLDDDRARFAVYTLNRVMREMSAGEVATALRQVPLRKVTVAKEVVRLAGDLGGDAGLALILELLEREDLHRDVRIAAQRGLWPHLHRDIAWTPFERAAVSEDPRVVGSLVRVPWPPSVAGRAAALIARALQNPDRRLRVELLELLVTQPTLSCEALTEALVRGAGAWHPEARGAALRAWAARLTEPELDRHVAIVEAMSQAERDAVINELVVTPVSASRALRVFIATNAWRRGDGRTALRAITGCGVPKLVLRVLEAAVAEDALHAPLVEAAERAFFDEKRPSTEAALSASPRPELRWLAVGFVERRLYGATAAPPEELERLRAYAADPSPLVRRRALRVRVPQG